MDDRYQLQDFSDALVIKSSQSKSRLNTAFNGVIFGSASAMFAFQYLGRAAAGVVSLLFCALGALDSLRGTNAELRVTNNEFQMSGRYGPDSLNWRSINAADLLGFTYLTHSVRGEDASYPGGLYALVGSQYICLLPYVGRHDAENIVDRIRSRFPHMSWLRVHEADQESVALDLN